MSALSDGRHLNNVDLALLCNHSVRIFHVDRLFVRSLVRSLARSLVPPFVLFLYQVSFSFSRALVNSLKSYTPSMKQCRSYKMLKINWWTTTGKTLK